jgi:hypothetical protein
VTRPLLLVCLAAAGAWAQLPKIGDINIYGLRKIPAERVLRAAGVAAGDNLPRSKGDLEGKLEEIPGVAAARVEAVCCEGTRAVLFIGIEERGGPHFEGRSEPSGDAALPEDLMNHYHEYMVEVQRAASAGLAAEDYSTGEPRLKTPAARQLQEGFAGFAAENLPLLRDVLHNASEAEQRAVAAAVIGYAPHKDQVLNDLQYALQDNDESVRANAVRSLKAIAVLAQKQPRLGLRVSPTWFVEMLNSIVLSDRTQAAEALVILTDQPQPAALELMRDRALPSLVEMARWKTLRYALPSFLLVGRIAGIPDAELQRQWQQGDRETAVRKALAPVPKRK